MARLTYKELIETCSALGVRQEKIIKALLNVQENVKFLIEQNLKMGVDIYKANKKTPWKRIDELEASLKGMNAFYQEKLSKLQAKPLKKDKEQTYEDVYK